MTLICRVDEGAPRPGDQHIYVNTDNVPLGEVDLVFLAAYVGEVPGMHNFLQWLNENGQEMLDYYQECMS